jgi:hypothetical protein
MSFKYLFFNLGERDLLLKGDLNQGRSVLVLLFNKTGT